MMARMFSNGVVLCVVGLVLMLAVSLVLVLKVRNGIVSVVLNVMWMFLFVWSFREFVVDLYVVPTGSMIPTIEVDDQVLGNRLAARFGNWDVGDIVTFDSPEDEGVTLVKRVVAKGGDVVDLTDDGRLLVNNVVSHVGEGHVTGETRSYYDGVTFPYEVPSGHIFVMGDNRENSGDSRVFGSVPESSLSSVVFLRVRPFERFGELS